MKEELYRKVYVKSEADLPKEKGEYFCYRKSDNRLLIFNRFIEPDREFEESVWMRNVDYYLQPEQPIEQSESKTAIKTAEEGESMNSLKDEIIHYQIWADNFRHEYGEDKSCMQLVNAYFGWQSKVKN